MIDQGSTLAEVVVEKVDGEVMNYFWTEVVVEAHPAFGPDTECLIEVRILLVRVAEHTTRPALDNVVVE